ncbi:MAG: GlxA family transcriptional regulator, partial [Candidatus Dormibacteria bacterium]
TAIDCRLHLVRRDHDSEVANRVARRLAIAPHHSSNQSQYVERQVLDANEPGAIESALTRA